MSTRSGRSSRATATPVSAFVAPSTSCPADSSRNFARVMLAGLSSTIRILAISGDDLTPRHGTPDLDGKAASVEVALAHDRRDITIELLAVFICYWLRGDDEDRYGCCVPLILEGRYHIESVDLRHHQIEHDQIRQLAPRGLDSLATAVGAQHRAGQANDMQGDQLNGFGIVIDDENLQRVPLRERNQAKLKERIVELLPGNWLLHDGCSAERESLVSIRYDRHDHDRDVFE